MVNSKRDNLRKSCTIKDQKYFHKTNFHIDFSVFSVSLEIILWHYCSTDCNTFGTGRKLNELCKQHICFISVVHLISKQHAFKLLRSSFSHLFRDVAINVNGNLSFSNFMQSLTSCLLRLEIG